MNVKSRDEVDPMKTREELAQYCDALLLRARDYASANHALITFPGDEGGYGRRVDGLEGFARTFLLAGFRLAGEKGNDPLGLADWYAAGLTAGTDPESPERWITLPEHAQAKVEAASIALILDLTRPWIWDRLDPKVQQNVINYLAPVVGDDTYPRNNWIWFRLVVQTFLRSVGGPFSVEDMADDLATHQSYIKSGGWYADGPLRAYDHYVGWAMHLYPALWVRMQGAKEIAGDYPLLWDNMLDRYLQDAIQLVGSDGAPLIEGRSLIYRYAAAAPFWIGALVGVPSTPMGQLREAALDIITYFRNHGVEDLLTIGWHQEYRTLAQSYSGPGSPYWATKGLLGIAFPADHPVWTAESKPLPSATKDSLFTIESPKWIVSNTKNDGIVRVINHGTDHAKVGDAVGDSPLYTRFGYSTKTAPLMDEEAWINPIDQSVALIDDQGRVTHRAGMTPLYLTQDSEVAIAASTGPVRWMTPDGNQKHHGSGYEGKFTEAGRMTVVSFVRGPWEIRLAKIQNISAAKRLRFGGWPIASNDEIENQTSNNMALAASQGAVSAIVFIEEMEVDNLEVGVRLGSDDSPLGTKTAVPWISLDPHENHWHAVAIVLTDNEHYLSHPSASLSVVETKGILNTRIIWPDQKTSEYTVPLQTFEGE